MIALKDLRDRLGLNPADDDRLKIIRDAVVALWEARTNRLWEFRTGHEQEFRLDELYERRGSLWLDLCPVTAVSLVEEWNDGDDVEELDADEFALIRARRIIPLTSLSVGPTWLQNVRVTYDGGYDDTDCPEDIREALAIQAQYVLHRHKGERSVLSGISGPGGSVQFMVSADIHPHFKAQVKLHARK